MTTLAAIVTKDALVMGCDSLGTVTKPLIDPMEIMEFFNEDADGTLKLDETGKPLLSDFRTLLGKTQIVPYNQMSHMTKLLSLDPLPMGVMHTGITSIGERTVRSLVSEFKQKDRAFMQGRSRNYTVRSVGERLLKWLWQHFSDAYSDSQKPDLELLIGGYDRQEQIPKVWRLRVQDRAIEPGLPDDAGFGIVFGGQTDWIQRIVFGTDARNKLQLHLRTRGLLEDYYGRVAAAVQEAGIEFELPKPEQYGDQLHLFNQWDMDGLTAFWGDFSEQNAIECIDFLVGIMIKSQQFSDRLPTVGGDVHIAVIRKDGLRFASREEWTHGDYRVRTPEAEK